MGDEVPVPVTRSAVISAVVSVRGHRHADRKKSHQGMDDKPVTEKRPHPSFIGADMPFERNKNDSGAWASIETNMADLFVILMIGGIMIGILVCVIHTMRCENSERPAVFWNRLALPSRVSSS
jgi:hypothetical protein